MIMNVAGGTSRGRPRGSCRQARGALVHVDDVVAESHRLGHVDLDADHDLHAPEDEDDDRDGSADGVGVGDFDGDRHGRADEQHRILRGGIAREGHEKCS